MRRGYRFNLAAALSLLLSLTAGVAWTGSYARPLDWHLLGIAHSADLRRVNLDRRSVVSMMPVQRPGAPHYGYWDAGWALSRSGRLTLLAQTADYEGNLRALYAAPPSLIAELSGPGRARAVAFGRMPDARTWWNRLGFAWAVDGQSAADDRGAAGGRVSVRARMITVPYWSIVLVGLLFPLLWLRSKRSLR